MYLGLTDNIVLITGSSKGIGFGIAGSFLEEEAEVILTGRHQNFLQSAQDELRKRYGPDRIGFLAGDLTNPSFLDTLAGFVESKYNRLDHLVCNLGTGKSVPPLEEDSAEWEKMLNLNLLSAVSTVQSFLPLLEKSAKKDNLPSITFVSSICGAEVLGCPIAYATVKSALNSYAKNIAMHLGKRGIRVNTVSPGNVIFSGSTWEDKLNRDRKSVETMLKKEVPLGRLGTVQEISDVIVFLASKKGAFVTGANWVVDGGQTRSF